MDEILLFGGEEEFGETDSMRVTEVCVLGIFPSFLRVTSLSLDSVSGSGYLARLI